MDNLNPTPITGDAADSLSTGVDLGNLAHPAATPSIRKMRDSHHLAARLIAAGKKTVEVAAITGYSTGYVSILLNDPAFKELLGAYREQQNVVYGDFVERLGALSRDAAATVHERLLEKPEEFSVKELLEVVRTASDRSGHGPTSTQITRNVLSAEVIERVKSLVKVKQIAQEDSRTPVGEEDSVRTA